MKKKDLMGIAVLAFFVLLMIGVSPFFVVDIVQTAIVVQLGKPVRTITEPGLKFKIPFIQEVIKFDKRLLDYDSEPQDVVTRDKKTLVIDNFAKWRIVDPLKFYEAFRTQRAARSRLDDIIYSELRVDLGQHDLSEIISQNRSEIMATVTRLTNEKALVYGIEIVDVRIKRADLPEQNEKAVFTRMQAERGREAKRYRSEGAEQAQKVRSEAEKEKEILLAEAYKTQQELMGKGDAEAFRIYAEAYGQDVKFFEFIRSMDAYKKVFKDGKSMIVLSPDSEFFKHLEGVK
ncbi:MAG: protease modulator HflC [Nitrospira sp.]|nr:protease modulator HflC [Candidatus Manganitrophaceae bacterium]HIL34727.1 protease modulator HflC [Candidatus Manganitrophaceae bacterium]